MRTDSRRDHKLGTAGIKVPTTTISFIFSTLMSVPKSALKS